MTLDQICSVREQCSLCMNLSPVVVQVSTVMTDLPMKTTGCMTAVCSGVGGQVGRRMGRWMDGRVQLWTQYQV